MTPAVTDATSRLKLKRHASRRRRILLIALFAAIAVLIGALVWLVGFSSTLAARRVNVTGTKVLQKSEVLDAAAVALGTPLLWVDPAVIADRVAGLPPVDSVTVARTWPDAISIRVSERIPRLAVSSGSGFLLADAAGVVFQAVDSPPSGLVRVDADPNDRQALIDVGTVFSALSPETARRVSRIQAHSCDSIILRLRDGSRIHWGSAEESAAKAAVVDTLLPLGGSVFDVSAPSHPARR